MSINQDEIQKLLKGIRNPILNLLIPLSNSYY